MIITTACWALVGAVIGGFSLVDHSACMVPASQPGFLMAPLGAVVWLLAYRSVRLCARLDALEGKEGGGGNGVYTEQRRKRGSVL
jgi:hypothetical protein